MLFLNEIIGIDSKNGLKYVLTQTFSCDIRIRFAVVRHHLRLRLRRVHLLLHTMEPGEHCGSRLASRSRTRRDRCFRYDKKLLFKHF